MPETILSSMNKGSNSVKNGRISPNHNLIPLIPDNNMYAKIEKKSVKKHSNH